MKGYRPAYSARIRGVASFEPSSTITQEAGSSDWPVTEPSVRRAYFSSSRQGVIRQYLRELIGTLDCILTAYRQSPAVDTLHGSVS